MTIPEFTPELGVGTQVAKIQPPVNEQSDDEHDNTITKVTHQSGADATAIRFGAWHVGN